MEATSPGVELTAAAAAAASSGLCTEASSAIFRSSNERASDGPPVTNPVLAAGPSLKLTAEGSWPKT